jgi:hypothetical protein
MRNFPKVRRVRAKDSDSSTHVRAMRDALWAQGLGFKVQGLGFREKGLGFMVQGLGFRV